MSGNVLKDTIIPTSLQKLGTTKPTVSAFSKKPDNTNVKSFQEVVREKHSNTDNTTPKKNKKASQEAKTATQESKKPTKLNAQKGEKLNVSDGTKKDSVQESEILEENIVGFMEVTPVVVSNNQEELISEKIVEDGSNDEFNLGYVVLPEQKLMIDNNNFDSSDDNLVIPQVNIVNSSKETKSEIVPVIVENNILINKDFDNFVHLDNKLLSGNEQVNLSNITIDNQAIPSPDINKNSLELPSIKTPDISKLNVVVKEDISVLHAKNNNDVEPLKQQLATSASFVSPQLVLADNSKQGQRIFSNLSKIEKSDKENSEGILLNDQSLDIPIAIDKSNKTLDFALQDNRFLKGDTVKTEEESEFGFFNNLIEEHVGEIHQGQNLGVTKQNILRPDIQISSLIKDSINTITNAGKTEITINLFPENLGHVKVEIISVVGEFGARKIQSIKITAEKKETLEILEKSRIELEKSLKEVTNTKEDASLQFEMNHESNQQGSNYFETIEERDNWMNNFIQNDVSETEKSVNDKNVSVNDIGYITANSVNIKV